MERWSADTGALPQPKQADAVKWIAEAFSAILRDRADQLGSRVVAVAARDVPEAVADDGLRREVSASGRLIVTAIIRQLAEGGMGPPDVDPRASELPRTFARRGLDVSVLLKVYRAGQDAFWAEVLVFAQAQEDLGAEQRLAVLVILWERFSAWVSSYIDAQIQLYQREREQWLRGTQARRSETLRAILEGGNAATHDASRALGYELSGTHAGIVLWTTADMPETDSIAVLEKAATQLAGTLSGGVPLTVAASSTSLWAWIPRPSAHSQASSEGGAVAALPDGIRAALGQPGTGVDGLRMTHREALEAQRVAQHARVPQQVTWYRKVQVAALASRDVPLMRGFVERTLGDLAGPDENMMRLRETLVAYLAHGGNVRLAGERIHAHKNTVSYRIRQAEEILGHPATDSRLELGLALALVDVFGDYALPQTES